MYTTFFGLRELPFPLANDPHFFYSTPATQKAEESIITAFHNHTGLVLLTGEPGTGKTTLLQRIISSLESHASVILLPFSAVTFDDILTYLCEHFAIVTSSDDPFTRVLAIQEHLQALAAYRRSVVLCIDEAQNIHKETLDRLRLLLHLKGPKGKLFQILLAGQPPLEAKLAHPDLRHLQQYITVHCRLEPLTHDAVKSFILHRLGIAGCGRTDLFTPEAVERIAEYSQRVPRSINVLCDNALIAAYLAGSQIVTLNVIEKVAQNLQLNNEPRTKFSEANRPSSHTQTLQETQETSRPLGHQWLHNLLWLGAGVAFAWLSSDPQLSTLLRFSPFSTNKTAQIVKPPTSSTIPPPPSAILARENQTLMTPLLMGQSLPQSETSTVPRDHTSVPGVIPKNESLLQSHPQPPLAAIPNPLPLKKGSDAEVPASLMPALAPPEVELSGLQQRQQLLRSPQSHTFSPQHRTHEASIVPIPMDSQPIREALLSAVATNNIQTTRRLLAAQAPVNTKDKRGWTALMIAARDNRPDLVHLLLSHGADANISNKEGETALIYAADNDHLAIVQLLLKHGASIDTKSNLGWTALMYAAAKGHRLTVETLLSNGANASVKDKNGKTASMYAAQQGRAFALEEHLKDRPALRNRFGRLEDERLQLVKRHNYRVIASLLKEAETKQ